jgi:hypothetical protein
MIVDLETLGVRPIADALMTAAVGRPESEIERGALAWSNELALHLVELKTNGPAPSLHGLAARFQDGVGEANRLLAPLGARLMPTAMHPWMDPETELRLWPHDAGAVYAAFDRVFGCRGHGWANVQSAHLNLPFADDDEFGRLHAALRLVLPLLPALAASSPVVDGRPTGWLDNRLEFYRGHTARFPSLTGAVIPEPVFTRAEYQERILGPIYADLAPHDPDRTLRHEWANARGCIARFDRGSIEVRILDVQECPLADLAVAGATAAVVEALARGELASHERQRRWPSAPLVDLLAGTARDGEAAWIRDPAYLRLLGYPGTACRARDLWAHLVERGVGRDPRYAEWASALEVILEEGCLARRITVRLAGDTRTPALREVYGELCRCLAEGRMFRGEG